MNCHANKSIECTVQQCANHCESENYCALDRILVETDAPSLTPAPVQHLANEPKYIVHVIDHICKVRGMERQELIDAVNENYKRLMGQ